MDNSLHDFKSLSLRLGVHDRVNNSHCKIPGYLTPHNEFAVGWISVEARFIHGNLKET
jgi:hypothetical protein